MIFRKLCGLYWHWWLCYSGRAHASSTSIMCSCSSEPPTAESLIGAVVWCNDLETAVLTLHCCSVSDLVQIPAQRTDTNQLSPPARVNFLTKSASNLSVYTVIKAFANIGYSTYMTIHLLHKYLSRENCWIAAIFSIFCHACLREVILRTLVLVLLVWARADGLISADRRHCVGSVRQRHRNVWHDLRKAWQAASLIRVLDAKMTACLSTLLFVVLLTCRGL